ncbi:MAG TPA: sigma-70 family RNA polymerase sigma factor [Gemmatimonadaceae bacterium]|nr:sigma-70 family RNA polymerase sigma factor [Gemmatimonadaceae bacterium]
MRHYVVDVTEGGLDDRRFEDFFVFEYPRLVSALRLVTGNADVARDAVDEACARACERLSRGRSIDVLGAWIRVAAFNVTRDKLRRRRSERLTRERLAQRATSRDDDLSADVAEAIDVRVALARLPRRQREVVVLFYFLDYPVETIARDLGIPSGTAKAALYRARIALADLLGEDAVEAGRIGNV